MPAPLHRASQAMRRRRDACTPKSTAGRLVSAQDFAAFFVLAHAVQATCWLQWQVHLDHMRPSQFVLTPYVVEG